MRTSARPIPLWSLCLLLGLPPAAAQTLSESPTAPQAALAPAPAAPALHRIVRIAGGQAMPPLQCPKPQRPPVSPPRPGESATAPAGSQEEELPLSDQEERELQALPAPSLEEIRKGLPQEQWLALLHQRLQEASQTRLARVGIWGGSHMAADFFVAELRRQMQARYGSGGAGHVNLLYGLPGLRLPVQALCRQGQWHSELAPRASGSTPIAAGLGLFMISSRQMHASLEIDPQAGNPDNAARSITLHYLQQPGGGRLQVWADGAVVTEIDSAGPLAVGSLQIQAAAPVSRLKLLALGSEPVSLLGAYVDDEQGLVIDNFGIAGASGAFWTHVRSDLLQQAAAVRPYDLVILAYGTNDITGAQWDPVDYRRRFEATLESMRQSLPQAMCVLITPGDRVTVQRVRKGLIGKDGKTRYVLQQRPDLVTYPSRHKEAALIQREIGQRHRCVTWDLSLEMRKAGGAYALMKQNPPWMARDLIHLTPLGYQEMARAFLKWLRL